MTAPAFKTQWDREPVQLYIDPEEPELTKQEFRRDSDVNWIVARFRKTGELPNVNQLKARYADVSVAQDYQAALQVVLDAEDAFYQLPAPARRAFNNDPGAFLDAVYDPERVDELVELGIFTKAEFEPEAPKGASGEDPPSPPSAD